MTRQPWFDAYETAPGRPTGLHVHAAGCVCTCVPAPAAPFLPADEPDDEPLVPAMPGLLGWIVALITAR